MSLSMKEIELNSLESSCFSSEDNFKKEVMVGLSKKDKQISSKYFYNQTGSKLFNQITKHSDYYLTHCEIEILNQYKKNISRILKKEPFNLIEFGPGEGIKTKLLIDQFLRDFLCFTYTPIDICNPYLSNIKNQFEQEFQGIEINPKNSEYLEGLESLTTMSMKKNFILFLGSSIGNFDPVTTQLFFSGIFNKLHDGDYVLIGFDLRKDIDIMIKAYNDSDGITRAFNLNLLVRMNHELGANFMIDKFGHYGTYNVYSGAMESYLVSLKEQNVHIGALEQSFKFEALEPIHVEYSYKYLLSQINDYAKSSGFKIVKNFFDSRQYYVNSLWQVNKKSID